MQAQPSPTTERMDAPQTPVMLHPNTSSPPWVGLNAGEPLAYQTTVHPCYVDGERTLVHRRGLAAAEPTVFARLLRFACNHGFAVLEDRRKRELTCRDERRRMAPLLMFATGLLSGGVIADDGRLRDNGVTVVPTIDVIGERHTTDRAYLIEAGKRFVSKPHGTTELILGVAAETRAKGSKQRVSTRGMQMPSEYTDSSIDRYDYTLPAACGGSTFSYYEGSGFAALGYHAEHGAVILDVLSGGGPFTAPRLWGAYDQVMNANVRMDLMFGDGQKDGMGLLRASYKIGLMPVMRTATKNYYGDLYSRAVVEGSGCSAPTPTLRAAAAAKPKTVVVADQG